MYFILILVSYLFRTVFKFSKIQTLQVLEFSIIYYYFLCICPCYFSKNIATQDAEGDANSFLRNSTYFVCGQEVREKNFFSMTTAIYFQSPFLVLLLNTYFLVFSFIWRRKYYKNNVMRKKEETFSSKQYDKNGSKNLIERGFIS